MSPKQKKFANMIKDKKTISTDSSDDEGLGQWSVLVSYIEEMVDEGAKLIPIVVEIVEAKKSLGVVQDVPIWYLNNTIAYKSLIELCNMYSDTTVDGRLKFAFDKWKDYAMRMEPYSSDNKAKVVGERGYAVTQLITWVPAYNPCDFRGKSACIKKTKDKLDDIANAISAAMTKTTMKKGQIVMEFWVHYNQNASYNLTARLEKDKVDPKKIMDLIGKVGKFQTLDKYFRDDEINWMLSNAFQKDDVSNNPEILKLGWRSHE